MAGGCQLFRRRCLEEIGGYIPNKAGGNDWIAVTTARMMGWKTRSFREKSFFHYRSLGTAETFAPRFTFLLWRKRLLPRRASHLGALSGDLPNCEDGLTSSEAWPSDSGIVRHFCAGRRAQFLPN